MFVSYPVIQLYYIDIYWQDEIRLEALSNTVQLKLKDQKHELTHNTIYIFPRTGTETKNKDMLLLRALIQVGSIQVRFKKVFTLV